ncbi:MAG: Na(+)-translocating NADH-quinone reductase subunit A [Thermoguttaceae bacterium]|jgi:Na+-transporting NADH:ubiquinone oxidoreductase subunit A
MRTIKVTKGLDLRLVGAPDQSEPPEMKDARLVAHTGVDYVGMKPTICVEEGDRVLAGQLLFLDKKNPGVKFTSPGAGVVQSVNRGAKRAFLSIIVETDEGDARAKSVEFKSYPESELLELDPAAVREELIESGLWIALRTRPYSRVPKVDSLPASLFVNVADTNPHAPDPKLVVDARPQDFINGLRVLSRICGKKLWICLGESEYSPEYIQTLESIPNAEVVRFVGKHPSGLSGTHIAQLDPCGLGKVVWTIGYQDVLAIATLFTRGVYEVDRVISIGGPMVKKPRLLRVQQGACLFELFKDELKDGPARMISGSVLHGRTATKGLAGLGRYVNQIAAIGDDDPRELFAWTLPGFRKFSASRAVASTFIGGDFKMTTALHGGPRAIFPNPAFDKIVPLDIVPLFLFKALEVGDIEKAEKLGAFELDEEDLALCSLVDFGKNDFGKTLRALLDQAMKEEE